MKTITITDALYERFQQMAQQEAVFEDDTNPEEVDWGGNVDDAYQGGYKDATIHLAREIIADVVK